MAEMKVGWGADGQECGFLDLFGDSVLGRLLADQKCHNHQRTEDWDAPMTGVCQSGLIDPMQYTWGVAWGMAFALQSPEWAACVLREFSTLGEGRQHDTIEALINRHPAKSIKT